MSALTVGSSSSSSLLAPSKFRIRPVVLSLIAFTLGLVTLALYDGSNRHVRNLAAAVAVCPNPSSWLRLPVDKPLQDVDFWYSDRRHLQSLDARFNITLSRSIHQPCNVFAIDIQRTDVEACRLAESRTDMSLDQDVLRYIKEELGPDTFMLRISGGQRWTSEMPRYMGGCKWRFDVSLSNGGDMWLELWHSYEVSRLFYKDPLVLLLIKSSREGLPSVRRSRSLRLD